MIMGFPGNLGGLAVSIVMPVGDPAYQLQVDPRPTSAADGDERGTKRWYRQAKETKCGEKGGKKSERLVVPLNQGNHPSRASAHSGYSWQFMPLAPWCDFGYTSLCVSTDLAMTTQRTNHGGHQTDHPG